MRIGILGGGLTGLALGTVYASTYKHIEVLEKETDAGGLMRTKVIKDFTFDYGGSHILFSKDKEALDFLLGLLGTNQVTRTRDTKILYQRRLVKYPFENGIFQLPPNDRFECVYDFVQNHIQKQIKKEPVPSNLEDWILFRFGKGIANRYLIPYNRKIWKYPLTNISTSWVSRIPDPPLEKIIQAGVGIETEGYTHQLHFQYPEHGGINAIISKLVAKNHQVITDFPVEQITYDNKWKVEGGGKSKYYDRLLSTIPLPELARALADKELIKLTSKLTYLSLATIMIGINQESQHNLSWIYIPHEEIIPHRISFPSNYSPFMAPKGTHSILAEVTYMPNKPLQGYSNEELKSKVTEQIIALFEDSPDIPRIKEENVLFSHLMKTKYAYIVDILGQETLLEAINSRLSKLGIYNIGRFGEFRYLNMDGCIRNVLDFKKNHPEIK